MNRTAIFLSGPVGAGKTTFGKALAEVWGGCFIDGDDHCPTDRRWFAASLTTARSLLAAIEAAALPGRPVIIAYPLRQREWTFHRLHLARATISSLLVSLDVDLDSLDSLTRERRLSRAERARAAEMLAQGYGDRPFGHLTVRTDVGSREDVLACLVAGLLRLQPALLKGPEAC